ncbi:probable glucan endo-1,3-beta-glucosidase A6 [Aristolochia californica]|uniref:probable glucan endo-1,3-beta-glucosidase A6 n=1 Tax=Aristolochia californica TaxID=171875 RepID=UPI0035E0DCBB
MSPRFRETEVGVLLLLISFLSACSADISKVIGVDYGQLGDNLPSPSRSISLIQTLKTGRVKIYDANPQILQALCKTDLQAAIMVPNQLISNISSSQSLADEWIQTNILRFYPQAKIRILLVGNEVLSLPDDGQTWYNIVPAMRLLKKSLKAHNIKNVKVGTTVAMDALQTSFPPSSGAFRPDISKTVMKPLLQFLNRTKSFFFLDVYTYFPWSSDPANVKLEYALLQPTNITYTDPGTGLTYTNLLDQMLDAVAFAMAKVGYPDVRIWIAETGWPNGGDIDQIGANIYNAATYNRNLVKKLSARPAVGTPVRPGWVLRAFIFALYNENQKGGPGTERHWGLLYPNGTEVYEVDLTGKKPESKYKPLPPATNNEPYKGKIWCVAVGGGEVNETALASAVNYACGQGNGTCDAIRPGRECYSRSNSLISQGSYAFNSYWHQFRSVGGTCFFGGLAVQTTKDPSHGRCKYPGTTI